MHSSNMNPDLRSITGYRPDRGRQLNDWLVGTTEQFNPEQFTNVLPTTVIRKPQFRLSTEVQQIDTYRASREQDGKQWLSGSH